MAESQEEKIKKIFSEKEIKIKDILEKMFPQGKGSYYNEVRKPKLTSAFVEGIKVNFGIDLVKELGTYDKSELYNNINDPLPGYGKKTELSVTALMQENIMLRQKIEEILIKGTKDKDRIIELLEQIASLKEELRK